MFCDSCCQQFSSSLSSCNFQPSSLRWYHFKKPSLDHSHSCCQVYWLFALVFIYALCEQGGDVWENGHPAQPAGPWAGRVVTFLSFVDLKIHSYDVSKDTQQTSILWWTSCTLCHNLIYLYVCMSVFLPIFYQQTLTRFSFNYCIKPQKTSTERIYVITCFLVFRSWIFQNSNICNSSISMFVACDI